MRKLFFTLKACRTVRSSWSPLYQGLTGPCPRTPSANRSMKKKTYSSKSTPSFQNWTIKFLKMSQGQHRYTTEEEEEEEGDNMKCRLRRCVCVHIRPWTRSGSVSSFLLRLTVPHLTAWLVCNHGDYHYPHPHLLLLVYS